MVHYFSFKTGSAQIVVFYSASTRNSGTGLASWGWSFRWRSNLAATDARTHSGVSRHRLFLEFLTENTRTHVREEMKIAPNPLWFLDFESTCLLLVL